MKTIGLALLATVAAAPLFAEDGHREMGAHVHGVSKLEMAVEGSTVEMNLESPGMDIVGFEYEPSTDADLAAVENAIAQLMRADELFAFNDAAGCAPVEAMAELHIHDGDEHDHGEDHADHEEEHHDEHGDEEHEHEEGARHTEFEAHYVFECEDTSALTTVEFPFFNHFENAHEIEAQYVTDAGAGSAEIDHDVAKLTLK
ncbi:DUF2796 domain-containing protein [Marivivens donghaensis]|uniref:DUF2796 domain-containing protein n=1 Tax=Marivivens donghaensis TaxID=1699413 RepID=A0ABX0W1G5_9RHOB|nr:DUF2796 domain-containing protein [Marivivens donghaensis]NIY73074.1 DUF2796 domain-containing protein [Marivivens donghaensis]